MKKNEVIGSHLDFRHSYGLEVESNTYLFAETGHNDLRELLRSNVHDDQILRIISGIIIQRRKDSWIRFFFVKIEMSYIDGKGGVYDG